MCLLCVTSGLSCYVLFSFKLNEIYVYILNIQMYEKLLCSYCEKICAVFIPGGFRPPSVPNGRCILDRINT